MFPLIAVKRNPEFNSSVFCEIKKSNSVLFVAVFFFGRDRRRPGRAAGFWREGGESGAARRVSKPRLNFIRHTWDPINVITASVQSAVSRGIDASRVHVIHPATTQAYTNSPYIHYKGCNY